MPEHMVDMHHMHHGYGYGSGVRPSAPSSSSSDAQTPEEKKAARLKELYERRIQEEEGLDEALGHGRPVTVGYLGPALEKGMRTQTAEEALQHDREVACFKERRARAKKRLARTDAKINAETGFKATFHETMNKVMDTYDGLMRANKDNAMVMSQALYPDHEQDVHDQLYTSQAERAERAAAGEVNMRTYDGRDMAYGRPLPDDSAIKEQMAMQQAEAQQDVGMQFA